MALSVASVSTPVNQGSGTTLNVNYPSSVAVGDLLLMHAMNVGSITTPSGWTLSESTTSPTVAPVYTAYLFWKIAVSGDVGQSTLAVTVSNAQAAGVMMRITGHDATTPIGADNSGNDGATAPASMSINGVTPAKILNLVLILTVTKDPDDVARGTVSNYAIATTSPTFTEQYDADIGAFFGMSAATGPRTVTTATGSVTADFSKNLRYAAIVASISPADESNTVTPAAGSLTATGPTPSLVASSNISVDAASVTSTAPSPTLSTEQYPQATNTTKNSATATNTNKNAATATNTTKNSASVTNVDKTS